MQDKKRIYKHLIVIYILYFIMLVAGLLKAVQAFTSGVSAGMLQAEQELANGYEHSYYVTADLRSPAGAIEVAGLPEKVEVAAAHLDLRVTEPGMLTIGDALRVQADSGYVYLLLCISGLLFLAVLVMIALMINSLRKSIRDEQPLRQSNIRRTRIVGVLLIVSEICNALVLYINQTKAAELLAGTAYEVTNCFALNYWNLIVGILFLFMAEVFAIGTQLSEEQKLTI